MATVATFSIGYAAYEISENPEGSLARMYNGSVVEGIVDTMLGDLWKFFTDMQKPQLDKVMDDWPYPGFPPVCETQSLRCTCRDVFCFFMAHTWANSVAALKQGTPPPPLLVLDVEKTILGSEWDSKYGWRHAMRPGVHQFLKEVSMVNVDLPIPCHRRRESLIVRRVFFRW